MQKESKVQKEQPPENGELNGGVTGETAKAVGAGGAAARPPLGEIHPLAGPALRRGRRHPPAEGSPLQRQQQALVEALALARSIDYSAQEAIPPELLPRGKLPRPAKAVTVRGRYRFPESEFERLGVLKARLRDLGLKAGKNDLLRAGLLLLGALNDSELKAVMLRIDGVRGVRSGSTGKSGGKARGKA